MNFIKRGYFFLSSIMSANNSSSESEQQSSSLSPEPEEEEEEEQEEAPVVEKKRERSPTLGEEEEEAAEPAAASAAAAGSATPPLPQESNSDPSGASAPDGSDAPNGSEDASSYEIDLPKATKRITRSSKAETRVEKRTPRERVLIVTVKKGKRSKIIEVPYIDFKNDVIVELKKAMIKRNLDYMDSMQAAIHAPKIFWNGIHHFGSFSNLDEELEKAGVPNGKRSRTRGTKRQK